jgi:hypothetical protein
MAIAIQVQTVQQTKAAQQAKEAKGAGLSKLVSWAIAPLYRLWWHTHAYATILGILFLTLLSLVALYLYEQSSRVLFKLKTIGYARGSLRFATPCNIVKDPLKG